MREEHLYVLALKQVSGIGAVLAKQLISYCGSAEAVFNETKGNLKKIPLIGEKAVESIKSSETLSLAEAEVEKCIKNEVSVLPYFHADYPEKLKLVNDAPLAIYYKGTKSYQNRKVVGIVGTRQATNYGKETTAEIVKDLVAHDAIIVSGLAYGIDIAAHRAAVEHDLPTVGVLAGGVDWVYPSAHKKTAEAMQEKGGLMSEQKLGTQPEAHSFPARNRIIAGMSDVLIVVEAAKKGGALITANIAHSYDREVFAVPGNLNGKYSEGCNDLIRSHKASIYTRIEDLEYLMNWEKGEVPIKETTIDLSSFSDDEQKILRILDEFQDGLHLDELSWKAQVPVNHTVSHLLNLEFSGMILSLPGKIYQLKR